MRRRFVASIALVLLFTIFLSGAALAADHAELEIKTPASICRKIDYRPPVPEKGVSSDGCEIERDIYGEVVQPNSPSANDPSDSTHALHPDGNYHVERDERGNAILPATSLSSSADGLDGDASAMLDTFDGTLYEWLDVLRFQIAPLLAGLSYAVTGFRVLGSSLALSKIAQGRGLEGAKSAIYVTTLAYAALLLLPDIIVWVTGLFSGLAWKPGA